MGTRVVAGIVALVLASCSAQSTPPTTIAPFSTTSEPPPSTTVPGPLSPSQVFAAVSPALAFIETSIGTGAGS